MNQRETKGHGFFRKSKAYGLVCGIALAGSLMMANTASADEVVETTPTIVLTDNPATNLPEAQPETPEANTVLAGQAGTQTGEMVSEVTSTTLNTGVSEAKEAGVIVSTEATVTHDSLASAQADLAKQEVAVKEATAKQEANNTAIDTAIAKNKEIDATNKAEAERVAKVNQEGEAAVAKKNVEGQKAVDEANKAGQAVVDKKNAEGQQATDEANAKAQAEADSENSRMKAEYDKQKAQAKAVEVENEAIRQRNAEAKARADEQNAAAMADYNKKKAELEAKLTEEGYAPKVLAQSLSLAEEETDSKVSITGDIKHFIKASDDTDIYRIALQAFKGNVSIADSQLKASIPNAKTWAEYGMVIPDGGKVTATFTNLTKSTYDGSPLSSIVMTVTGHSKDGSDLVLWLSDKLTSGYEIYSQKGGQSDDVTLQFFDETGKAIQFSEKAPALFGFGSLNRHPGSIEYISNYNFEFVTINGSSIVEHADGAYSDGDNDYKANGSRYDNKEWDPDGSPLAYYGAGIGYVTSGDTIRFTAGNKELVGHWTDITTKVSAPTLPSLPRPVKVDYETEKEVPPTPVEPKYVTPVPVTFTPETFTPATFTPETYTPITPKVIPHVNVPAKETHKVAVHPVKVRQTPDNDKSVINRDKVSVDGKLVAKGELVAWELTNENLKAGREMVTAYVMTDPLPAGFIMDKDLTSKNNPDWIVATNEAGTVSISATQATLNSLNKDLSKAITIPKFLVYGRTTNDGATYENTFKTTITTPKGSYTVTSDTPVIYTPGNNPNTPRNKGGEDPTPNDNLIKPEKDVVDDKGNSINGKSVLPNTKLNYVAKQDFDQYKGMVASKEAIGKGFAYIDDYLDSALNGKSLTVNSITAANGDDVRELLEMYHVLSMESIDEKLSEMVKAAGISPVGEFYMWVAKDPQAFYKAYVQKGLDITYNLSFEINKDFKEGDITNQTFQLDFGNGYYGNVVTNTLPVLSVQKNVVKDNKDLDGKEVKLGDEFEYVLSGWVIPANRGYDISEYRFVDKLQVTHDEYKAYEVVAKVDITLADGTVLKAGTDLAKYADQVYNAKTGLFELKFRDEFLAQIPRTSEFGASTYLTVKRIKAGEVTNEFTLFVNDNEIISNKVVTTTPEPPKPEKPQVPAEPKTPTPEPTPEKVLPKTGDAGSLLPLAGAFLGSFGLVGLKRRKN